MASRNKIGMFFKKIMNLKIWRFWPSLTWHWPSLRPNLKINAIIEFCDPIDPLSMCRTTLKLHFHLVTLFDLTFTLTFTQNKTHNYMPPSSFPEKPFWQSLDSQLLLVPSRLPIRRKLTSSTFYLPRPDLWPFKNKVPLKRTRWELSFAVSPISLRLLVRELAGG